MSTLPRTQGPELTAEQKTVVGQPWDTPVLVTAGAGSGKTHTLVRRLDALVERDDLSASGVLVLTFSRAAVRELRDRLARHGETARHVQVSTFDSWATRLLSEIDDVGPWRQESYDGRVRLAAEAIEQGRTDLIHGEGERELRHVVLDEAQDLVGERRHLMEALLERFDCGFTVVGDPAQAIYGFRGTSEEDEYNAVNGFLDWLRGFFGEDLVELRLTRNFRARTEEAGRVLDWGTRLQEPGSDPARAEKLFLRMRAELGEALDFGDLSHELVQQALRHYQGTCAVLCRTNGEALLISGMLHLGGVPHQLRRRAGDRVVPSWIASLFPPGSPALLTRRRFDELLRSSGEVADEERWTRLLRAVPGAPGARTVDLAGLARAVASGTVPDDLTAQPSAGLVVSSIHRAKGLEFDRVLVVEPVVPLGEPDLAEEARVLYVAMTRAREDLMRLRSPAAGHSYVKKDAQRGRDPRWARYVKANRNWRLGLELRGGDVHTVHPPGTQVFSADPRELQGFIASGMSSGDDLLLSRAEDASDEVGRIPHYVLSHLDRPVGIASETFRADLQRHLRFGPRTPFSAWPERISDIRLDTVETVHGSEAAAVNAGLGEHGIWLAPRPVGLGRFHWPDRDGAAPGGRTKP